MKRTNSTSILLARIAFFVAILMASHGGLMAQQPGDTPGPSLPTIDEVQQRLDGLSSNKEIDESKKAELTRLYTETLGHLRDIEQRAQQTREFEAARAGAPEKLSSLKEKLSTPPEPLPSIPPNAVLADMEALLTTAQATLEAASREADQLTTEASARSERRRGIPQLLVQIRQSLTTAQQESGAAPREGAGPETTAANRTKLAAQAEALSRQVVTLETEIQSYEARGDLLAARTELATRQRTRAQKVVEAYQAAVNRLREAASKKAEEEARRTLRDVKEVPLLASLAERNKSLAEQRSLVSEQLAGLAEEVRKAEERYSDVDTTFKDAQKRVAVAGLTGPLGILLRKIRDDLIPLRLLRREISDIEEKLADAELAKIERESERSRLTLENWKEDMDDSAAVAGWSKEEIETKALELIEAQRTLLRGLVEDHDRTFDSLLKLDSSRRLLLVLTEEYLDFIDERILWIRSSSAVWREDPKQVVTGLSVILDPENWWDCIRMLGDDLNQRPELIALLVILVISLGIFNRWCAKKTRALGDGASRGSCTSMLPTVYATLLTASLASWKPLILWLVGWRLAASTDAPELVRGIATGLRTGAVYLVAIEVLRNVTRPKGLGESHFRWRPESLRIFRRHLRWISIPGLVVVLFVAGFRGTGQSTVEDAIGRVGFLIGMFMLLILVRSVLNPSKGILAPDSSRADKEGWLVRTRVVWYILGVGGIVGLFLMAAFGFYFTSVRLFDRVAASGWLLLLSVLFYGYVLRALLLARRRLLLKQVKERMAARETSTETQEVQPPEDSIDVTSVDQQSRQLIKSLIGVGLIVGAWLIWAEVFPALGFLDQVELWSTSSTVDGVVTEAPITLASLIAASLAVILTTLAAKNIPGVLEISLLQRLPLNHGERYAIKTLAQYAIVLVGIVLSFAQIGIGWSNIQWLAAALTVGLGFGLQEIFANFFSGLILLFERPIRVGDIVTVGTMDGRVTRIRMRATTITDYDNRELIVPNKTFVTGSLVNWTLTDPITRVVIPVGAAYGSDVPLTRDTLVRVAKSHPLVLEDPAPSAIFRSFGESTLDFQLRIHIATRDVWAQVIHELNDAIHSEFGKLGIVIAFPQRDLHVRSADGIMEIVPRDTRGGTQVAGNTLNQPLPEKSEQQGTHDAP